ncbi:sulfurtransferase [Myroides sp. M-43]|uniref:sulfurtransferase n=1 Tax=Myroides oncorhynchi TaxID=2893756 RepID=UPI001E2DD579|nr:sulfurtransferase [Myroides oncorhynchi]MCC9043147.1 sulfurtransferase [Myroides oncorhynchi]
MKPIITPQELRALKHSNTSFVLIDATNSKVARENYDNQHLDGSIFVDGNTQLAEIGEDASKGGRHPLPSVEKFGQSLQDLGITPDSHVIIYDTVFGGNSAARFWWMLTAVGHQKVQVLSGGMAAAEKVGYLVNNNKVKISEVGVYPTTVWQLPLADINEIEANTEREDYIVIDVREENRYKGISEPIDTVAGHIPGAVNIPYMSNLDSEGLFLSEELLREKYSAVLNNYSAENSAVHCGSGITACHTLLAITAAGLPTPKLYVGSWSEWSRSGKTIATDK